MTIMCLWALGSDAVGVKQGSVKTLVDSCGFFPQVSADGQWLLYSPTEGTSLMLKNLVTGGVTTVATTGYPGFDAIIGGDGKVYYVTQQRKKNGLLYRTAHCYDPLWVPTAIPEAMNSIWLTRAARHVCFNPFKRVTVTCGLHCLPMAQRYCLRRPQRGCLFATLMARSLPTWESFLCRIGMMTTISLP